MNSTYHHLIVIMNSPQPHVHRCLWHENPQQFVLHIYEPIEKVISCKGQMIYKNNFPTSMPNITTLSKLEPKISLILEFISGIAMLNSDFGQTPLACLMSSSLTMFPSFSGYCSVHIKGMSRHFPASICKFCIKPIHRIINNQLHNHNDKTLKFFLRLTNFCVFFTIESKFFMAGRNFSWTSQRRKRVFFEFKKPNCCNTCLDIVLLSKIENLNKFLCNENNVNILIIKMSH